MNSRELLKKRVIFYIVVCIILFIVYLFIFTLAGAEEPGNGVFPLQCIEFQPGRTFDWIGTCPFLPMIYNGAGLDPMPSGR